MAYFITGGTGFVGTEVIAVLLKASDVPIYTLVRAADEKTAVHRLKKAWYDLPELCDEIGKRIRPIPGDFLRKDLGLTEEQMQGLKGKISRIFHVGAETGIQKSKAELMAENRDGNSKRICPGWGCFFAQDRFYHGRGIPRPSRAGLKQACHGRGTFPVRDKASGGMCTDLQRKTAKAVANPAPSPPGADLNF